MEPLKICQILIIILKSLANISKQLASQTFEIQNEGKTNISLMVISPGNVEVTDSKNLGKMLITHWFWANHLKAINRIRCCFLSTTVLSHP